MKDDPNRELSPFRLETRLEVERLEKLPERFPLQQVGVHFQQGQQIELATRRIGIRAFGRLPLERFQLALELGLRRRQLTEASADLPRRVAAGFFVLQVRHLPADPERSVGDAAPNLLSLVSLLFALRVARLECTEQELAAFGAEDVCPEELEDLLHGRVLA